MNRLRGFVFENSKLLRLKIAYKNLRTHGRKYEHFLQAILKILNFRKRVFSVISRDSGVGS